MSKIRAKNSRIELLLFDMLARSNVAFKRHYSLAMGRPDIALADCKVAVFVDGDFWHGRDYASWRRKLSDQWKTKIEANIRRDARVNRALRRAGWCVLRIWGKDIQRFPERCLKRILKARDRRLVAS